MSNKDFQNGFALGLVSGGVEKLGIEPLDHTVIFKVDEQNYQIITVKDGQSISAPSPNPTSENGAFGG